MKQQASAIICRDDEAAVVKSESESATIGSESESAAMRSESESEKYTSRPPYVSLSPRKLRIISIYRARTVYKLDP